MRTESRAVRGDSSPTPQASMRRAAAYASAPRPGTPAGTGCHCIRKSPVMRPRMPSPMMPLAKRHSVSRCRSRIAGVSIRGWRAVALDSHRRRWRGLIIHAKTVRPRCCQDRTVSMSSLMVSALEARLWMWDRFHPEHDVGEVRLARLSPALSPSSKLIVQLGKVPVSVACGRAEPGHRRQRCPGGT